MFVCLESVMAPSLHHEHIECQRNKNVIFLQSLILYHVKPVRFYFEQQCYHEPNLYTGRPTQTLAEEFELFSKFNSITV